MKNALEQNVGKLLVEKLITNHVDNGGVLDSTTTPTRQTTVTEILGTNKQSPVITNKVSYNRQLEEFITESLNLSSNIRKLCKLLSKRVDEHPSFIDDLSRKGCPIPYVVLQRMYKIGKNRLLPELLFNNSPMARVLEKLPIKKQEELLESTVEVVDHRNPNGVVTVPVLELNQNQVKTIVDSNTGEVLPITEQQKVKFRQSKPVQPKYEITNDGNVVFRRPNLVFTVEELTNIIEQMKQVS